jgi:hypothetical protein
MLAAVTRITMRITMRTMAVTVVLRGPLDLPSSRKSGRKLLL